jgi:hypothetical protein
MYSPITEFSLAYGLAQMTLQVVIRSKHIPVLLLSIINILQIIIIIIIISIIIAIKFLEECII